MYDVQKPKKHLWSENIWVNPKFNRRDVRVSNSDYFLLDNTGQFCFICNRASCCVSWIYKNTNRNCTLQHELQIRKSNMITGNEALYNIHYSIIFCGNLNWWSCTNKILNIRYWKKFVLLLSMKRGSISTSITLV